MKSRNSGNESLGVEGFIGWQGRFNETWTRRCVKPKDFYTHDNLELYVGLGIHRDLG